MYWSRPWPTGMVTGAISGALAARGSRWPSRCEAARELAARLDDFETAGQIESEALRRLVPAITGRWRDAVREDVAADPFTAREEAVRAQR